MSDLHSRRSTDPPGPGWLRLLNNVVLGAALLVLLPGGLAALAWRSRCIETFQDFGAPLPTFTELIVGIPTWAALLAAVAAPALLIFKEGLIDSVGSRLGLNAVGLFAGVLGWGSVVVGCQMAMIKLMNDLS